MRGQTLVIPYLDAKLALRYPYIALLVNFHLGHVKQGNREKGNRYWGAENADAFVEWLTGLNCHDPSQVEHEDTQTTPAGPPALMDEPASYEDLDSPPREVRVEADSQSQH